MRSSVLKNGTTPVIVYHLFLSPMIILHLSSSNKRKPCSNQRITCILQLFLPELTGSVNSSCFSACAVHCTSLYSSSKRVICKSLVELYLNVIHRLFPKEQRVGGGFSVPQNVPMSWLEHLGPSLISK